MFGKKNIDELWELMKKRYKPGCHGQPLCTELQFSAWPPRLQLLVEDDKMLKDRKGPELNGKN